MCVRNSKINIIGGCGESNTISKKKKKKTIKVPYKLSGQAAAVVRFSSRVIQQPLPAVYVYMHSSKHEKI